MLPTTDSHPPPFYIMTYSCVVVDRSSIHALKSFDALRWAELVLLRVLPCIEAKVANFGPVLLSVAIANPTDKPLTASAALRT